MREVPHGLGAPRNSSNGFQRWPLYSNCRERPLVFKLLAMNTEINPGLTLLEQYENVRPSFVRLADNLRHAVQIFLVEKQIDVLDVSYRIKKFQSFTEKIERKKYKNPFKEVQDICGLRIIAFYASDLDKIDEIIQAEFDVLESVNKLHMLESDRFGYRSQHYVVKVKKGWLNAPNYRGLKDFVAEIQVRTILMHAWADLSHKLAYKEESQIPPEFRREVNQLSALFELADKQFERLREQRASYRRSLTSTPIDHTPNTFNLSAPLNFDSLKAFLSFHFKDRHITDDVIVALLDQLMRENITFADIAQGIETVRDSIQQHEEKTFKNATDRWNQGGIVRHILDVTHNKWWKKRRTYVPEFVIKNVMAYRKEIKSRKLKPAAP